MSVKTRGHGKRGGFTSHFEDVSVILKNVEKGQWRHYTMKDDDLDVRARGTSDRLSRILNEYETANDYCVGATVSMTGHTR